MIFSPKQEVTKSLSNSSTWIGDVQLFTSAIDVIDKMDVTYVAMNPKSALVSEVSERFQMILGTIQRIPFGSVRELSSEIRNEYVAADYLNTRFSAAVHACYGYDYRFVADEKHGILRVH